MAIQAFHIVGQGWRFRFAIQFCVLILVCLILVVLAKLISGRLEVVAGMQDEGRGRAGA